MEIRSGKRSVEELGVGETTTLSYGKHMVNPKYISDDVNFIQNIYFT